MNDGAWFWAFFLLLIAATIVRQELRDECEEHGKNVGKTM